jgi:hypothetical protein
MCFALNREFLSLIEEMVPHSWLYSRSTRWCHWVLHHSHRDEQSMGYWTVWLKQVKVNLVKLWLVMDEKQIIFGAVTILFWVECKRLLHSWTISEWSFIGGHNQRRLWPIHSSSALGRHVVWILDWQNGLEFGAQNYLMYCQTLATLKQISLLWQKFIEWSNMPRIKWILDLV